VVKVRKRQICLVGFSGSGKSSVGPLLAKRLRCGFEDIDKLIEKDYGDTVSNIFANEGERGFRKLESQMIQRVLTNNKKANVVALGGGAFENSANRSLIQERATVVWLSCSVREIHRRLKVDSERPLLAVKPQSGESVRESQIRIITKLMQKRIPAYSQSDIRVSTSRRTTAQVVSKLIPLLRSFNDAS